VFGTQYTIEWAMRRTAMLAASIAALCMSFACTRSARREASSLASAIDRYRRADNATKAAEAQLVGSVACTEAKVCDAKRACLAAIDPTARALGIKDEVARRLSDVEHKRITIDSADVQALPSKLDEAEKLLNEGRAKMPDCERKLADLLVEYGA
jgi:hypothetical protein